MSDIEQLLLPTPDDSSDLRWSLETAVSMLRSGHLDRALEWSERALTVAAAEGRPERVQRIQQAVSRIYADVPVEPRGSSFPPDATSIPPPRSRPRPDADDTPLSDGKLGAIIADEEPECETSSVMRLRPRATLGSRTDLDAGILRGDGDRPSGPVATTIRPGEATLEPLKAIRVGILQTADGELHVIRLDDGVACPAHLQPGLLLPTSE